MANQMQSKQLQGCTAGVSLSCIFICLHSSPGSGCQDDADGASANNRSAQQERASSRPASS